MFKRFTVLALSGLVFAACQPAAPAAPSDSMGASSSSVAAMMDASSSADAMADTGTRHGGEMAWGVVADWSTDLAWSEPVAGSNADAIHIDADHMIDAGMIQARTSTATLSAAQYKQYFVDGRAALDTAMVAQGWKHHLMLDADGPNGTQWGYIHTDKDGTRFVIVSADSTKNVAKVTLTDMLTAGDDM